MTEFKFRVSAARAGGSGKWLPLRLAVAGPAARASLTRFKSVGSLNFTVARAAPAAVAAAVQLERGRSAGESGPGANLKLASLSE